MKALKSVFLVRLHLLKLIKLDIITLIQFFFF